MCKECGCGLPGDTPVQIRAHGKDSEIVHEHSHRRTHAHDHGHKHAHEHEHSHDHLHDHHHHHHDHGDAHSHTHEHAHVSSSEMTSHSQAPRTLEIRRSILEKNERMAERNRGFFLAQKVLVL